MSVGMIVCRSTDSGAPLLTNTYGSLCAVLDWALAKKGWTTTATGTNQRIYQTAAGNGYCLYVANDSVVSGNVQRAVMRGCESSSTLASLVNPFPTVAQQSNALQTAFTSSLSGGAQYVIYVTDRYIRMYSNASGTGVWYGWHFGDLVGTVSGDSYNTIMSGPNSGTFELENYVASNPCYFARDVTGTILSSQAYANVRGMTNIGSCNRGPVARAGYMNRIVREKVAYDCYGSTSSALGPTALASRGWVPNWWAPLHNGMGALSMGDTFADSSYNPSATFRVYGFSSSAWSIQEETDTWSAPVG